MAKLDPRLASLVGELRSVLREKGVHLQDVDAAKGWAKGYLSQLVNGHVDMKLAHLFDALEVAKVEPAEFFARLAGRRAPSALEGRVAELEALVRAALHGAGPRRPNGAEEPPLKPRR